MVVNPTAIPVPLPVDDLAVLRRRRSAKWHRFAADVLPLPVAEMDFSLAPPISGVLAEAVRMSDTGYAIPGTALGEALAGFAAARWDWVIDPEAVVAATDVGMACVELLRILCPSGAEVVISPPVYPPFFHWVEESGSELVEAPLRQDLAGSWALDLDGLAQAFARRPAAYILCNPQNPVGRVHSADELAAVVRLAHEHGVTIISDEIHGPLVLPGQEFTPLLTVPGAAEIGVSLVSASKAWNLAGLKCGLIVSASPAMRAVVDRRPEDTRWRVGHFGVMAAIAAFTDGGPWLDALIATLDQRRTELGSLLTERLPDVRWSPPEATFLAWLDCRAYGSGSEPCDLFLERGRVGLEPGPSFGSVGSGWVRLNFGTSGEILDAAVTRMATAIG